MLEKIRSKNILKTVFEYIKKKDRLKIVRYNKKLQNKLNIKKKDFQDYKLLKQLNKKYNLSIEDIDIITLNLTKRKLDDNFFNSINDIGFNNLKELNIIGGMLSNIDFLVNPKFQRLEKLVINKNNYLKNINALEKVDFKDLKELNLKDNIISNINVLESVKFEKLEILNLSSNLISDINILKEVNFKKLKELNLKYNKISDIN